MTRALTVADVIAGEAVSGTTEERIADMRAIASVIANRANLLGVTQQQVVANQNEFNIYGQRMPPGTTDLVGMAQEAVDYVAENGPVHSATFYATPAAVSRLPGGLTYESETAGHQYFSDPQNRAIYTSEGLIAPNQYSYAANLESVPTPTNNPYAIPTENPAFLAGAQLANVDPNMALAVPDAITNLPAADLATAQTFEKAAPSVNPWGGAPLSNVAASGFLGASSSLEAGANVANSGVLAGPKSDTFSQVAAAGPMGGDYAAPEDRFAAAMPGGFLNVPANQVISQSDVQRALFNATGAEIDPGLSEALMSPEYAVAPMAVESQTITPNEQSVDIASSRFSTPAKTSRIGQDQAFADARMPGLIDPATNTTGFLDQPADIGGFLEASAAQRGPATGTNSAEMGVRLADIQRQLQNPELQAQPPSVLTAKNVPTQTAGLLNNPAMATPNFAQAMSPSVPALASTPVDPSQYQMREINTAAQIPGVIAAGQIPSAVTAYVDEAATAPAVAAIEAQSPVTSQSTSISSALLSPTSIASMTPALTPAFSKGILPSQPINQVGFLNSLPADVDINLSGNIVPSSAVTAPAPALETVEVADQPDVATVPGPATTDAPDQQETQTTAKSPTTVARTTPAVTRTQPSFVDKMKTAVNPGTALGALVGGGLLGIPGAAIGGFLGNTAYQNTGFLNQPGMTINPIGSGYENVTSIWSGSQPPGTQATASDGQTVTAMSGGRTAITGKSGVVTVFDANGKAMSYFGNDLDPNQDQDQTASTSSGGFFGGLFN